MSTQQQEPRMNCVDCDYSLCEGEFDSGKGRIMFNDVNEDGTKYRCGCCDDRVADPHGMFPNDEEESDEGLKCSIFLTEDDLNGKTGEMCEMCEQIIRKGANKEGEDWFMTE